jgi:hypothetical protein
MDTKILREWPFWLMVGLFILTVVLMLNDPFGLDPAGEQSTSVIKVLYFIPALAGIYWFFVRPTIKK